MISGVIRWKISSCGLLEAIEVFQTQWDMFSGEAGLIGESIRQFETIYWGRTGSKTNVIGATDEFIEPSPEPGEPTPTPTPVPTPAPSYIDGTTSYSVIAYNADGSEKWDGTAGVLSGAFATFANNSFAIRPALYVKAEAVVGNSLKSYTTGGKVYFGGRPWTIVGWGEKGQVPGSENTLTLFAESSLEEQYATTSLNYSEGELAKVMQGLGENLGLNSQQRAAISSRTLTTEDGISGASVRTDFWPLSQSEYEAIQQADRSLLMGDTWPYWLRTEAPADWELYKTVYAGDSDGSLTQSSTPKSMFGVRPAFYLDLTDLFFGAGAAYYGQGGGRVSPPSSTRPIRQAASGILSCGTTVCSWRCTLSVTSSDWSEGKA